MRRATPLLLAALVAAAAPASAAWTLPRVSWKAEKKVQRWLRWKSALRKPLVRLKERAARAEVKGYEIPAVFADRDFKDALADNPVEAASAGEGRTLGCASFASCALPPTRLDVAPGEPVEPAVLALLRPWLWLAELRGLRVSLSPARGGQGRALLLLSVPELGLSEVPLSADVRPGGGITLWLDRGMELSAAYARSRGAS